MNGPFVHVDVIVTDPAGRLLLGTWSKRWTKDEVWGLPGKDIQAGETIGDAVKRNMREEFDCSVSEYRIIGVNANRAFDRHSIGIVTIVIPDSLPDGVVRTQDWGKWEWFAPDALPAGIFPGAQSAIETFRTGTVCVQE